MSLTPQYDVLIEVSDRIKEVAIYSDIQIKPTTIDKLRKIEEENWGLVFYLPQEKGAPYLYKYTPLYAPNDVAEEIKRILLEDLSNDFVSIETRMTPANVHSKLAMFEYEP